MPIHSFRPLTPAGRFTALNKTSGQLSRKRPERGLTQSKNKTGGRNVYGRVTSRHRGGGHKQLYRIVDFKRARLDLPELPHAGTYHTVGGLMLALLGRLPKEGDRIVWSGWRFEVLDMDGRRVDKVLALREEETA